MAEFEGPPRKTTTYKQFSGMNSQDQRYGVELDEFFLLENIMRVADGKLHSVFGPSAIKATFPNSGDLGGLLLEIGLPNFVLLETGGDDTLLLE